MSIAKWLLAKKLGGGGPFPSVIKRVTGNPIEFTDGASAPLVKCVSAITGSQDLHGYDKPWVGGAGKNKLPDEPNFKNGYYLDNSGNEQSMSNYRYTQDYIPTDASANYCLSLDKETSDNIGATVCLYNSSKQFIERRGVIGGTTQTGRVSGSFSTTAETAFVRYSIPLSSFEIQMESGSTATNYEPYSNICPITAYTEGKIEVRGKNLISGYTANTAIDNNGAEYTNTGCCISNKIKIQSGASYILTFEKETNLLVAHCYDEDDNYIDYYTINKNVAYVPSTFFTGTSSIIIQWVKSGEGNVLPANGQFEKGTTATTYESYKGTTHTTTFPTSIYQGSEDVVNGEVTSEMVVVDLGDLTWTLTAQGYYMAYPSSLPKPPAQSTELANIISDSFETVSAFSIYSGGYGIAVHTSSEIRVRYEGMPSVVSDFVSEVTGKKVAYELAAPTTTPVTPTNLPIKSLSGYNHIESSTGDMTIDYITEGYQNFVDTVESALPNTRKGGTKAMDVFMALEPSTSNTDAKEEVKKSEK